MDRLSRKTSRLGLTQLEIVVVLAVVAVLAAVMMPTLAGHLRDSRLTRAGEDVEAIGASVRDFFHDGGRWPNRLALDESGEERSLALLVSEAGALPEDADGIVFASLDPTDTFENQLRDNTPAGSADGAYDVGGELEWKGPYPAPYRPDPWGRKYLCNVAGPAGGTAGPVWVLSAGPDGVVDTPADARALGGDDVGLLLRR